MSVSRRELMTGLGAMYMSAGHAAGAGLRLVWANNMLAISGEQIPGGEVKVWYLEAYCRPGSTDRDWAQTVIGHTTKLMEASADGKLIRLRCALKDGVEVHHEIRAGKDEVDFRVVAANPSSQESEAHWAQPCIRVDKFVGVEAKHSSEEYLPKSFIFVNGKLTRMKTEPWATRARYTPGQTWRPKHVDRNDACAGVNPRPLSSIVPSNGLIGCFAKDEKMILATAWEPYQELFQGVIVCLHSDFRLGGLKPGETKKARGKVYIVPNDACAGVNALVQRYQRDFPEHQK